MFVSTKHLSLMQLIPRARRSPTQIKTPSQTGHRAAARLLVPFSLAHRLFQASRDHGADGSTLFGGEDAGFAQQVGFDLQGDVGFHDRTSSRAALFYVL